MSCLLEEGFGVEAILGTIPIRECLPKESSVAQFGFEIFHLVRTYSVSLKFKFSECSQAFFVPSFRVCSQYLCQRGTLDHLSA